MRVRSRFRIPKGKFIEETVSFFFSFGHAAWHVGTYPNQGLNPCPLQWEHGVLTTGLPGKSRGDCLEGSSDF